jgi:N-methylhydantoinase A
MTWRIGVDSGGTFTDVCLFEEDSGQIEIWKVSSTPDDPSRGISTGIQEGLVQVGAAVEDLSFLGHGTTVGTNAIIQLRGARTGLITTDGFRDLLEIGRQKRPDLYDLEADKPETLVSRDNRIEIVERVRCDGSVEKPLDEAAVREAAARLRESGVKAVAVSYLYGFLRADHEKRTLEILREELPDAFVCASHEVAPEFREYERTSTTAVNAYLGPIMKTYIDRLHDRLTDLGLTVEPHLTQSNGGVIGFPAAAQLPVRTVLSGPSTGVVAAQEIGKVSGMPDLITFDMGGTSSDVALLSDGKCRMTGEAVVHGYPIKAPMLDIYTVGAGGGSIAYVDDGGLLKVGPRSAGAAPGPVCYDKGNQEPTVTDANVVLQTLNPTHLLNGRMPIKQALAKDAISRLAEKLGLDLLATASGIISVVTANMARAIRVISVQRGHDPRQYTLTAFGGAGPLHAARLARELEMKRIMIPRTPGILCAMGLLLTDLRADFTRTRVLRLDDAAITPLDELFEDLAEEADRWFDRERVAPASRQIMRTLDMRYEGQNYELSIPLPQQTIDDEVMETMRSRFLEAHQRQYGFVAEADPIQIVTGRMEAMGVVRKASLTARPKTDVAVDAAIIGRRDVYFPETGGFISCPVYAREKLDSGHHFTGPAIVEQMDATTVVLPGMSAIVDSYLNLILEDL